MAQLIIRAFHIEPGTEPNKLGLPPTRLKQRPGVGVPIYRPSV